jgi:hypothetical protein
LSLISLEHASLGARQVFEELSLHADIFCNICNGFELPSRVSLGVNQHQPWPPPDDLRLTSCDAGLRPTPSTTTGYYAEPLRFRYTNSTVVLAPLRLPLSASKGNHGHEKAEAQGVHIRDRCNSPSVHYLINSAGPRIVRSSDELATAHLKPYNI